MYYNDQELQFQFQQYNMKKSSRNWTPEQDKMLELTMRNKEQGRKLKWEQIAQLMHQKILTCQKTGKQCRQRWHNHLAPQLNNSSQWTKQQNETLFERHNQLGNKWAKIATYLKGRTDNCVKNHFYSTLRRGMRKVNNFIHDKRKQKGSIKQFKPDVLTKILIVADGDPQQKLNAKNNANQLSKQIKQLLIKVSLQTDENTYDEDAIDQVIKLIMQFNKNCKKRKGKKKASTTEKLTNLKQISEQQELSEESQQMISQTKKVQSEQFVMKQEKKQVFINKESPKQKQKDNQQNKVKIQIQQQQQTLKQKSREQKQNIIVENKIIVQNFSIGRKVEVQQQVEVKDAQKIIDFSASIVYEKQQGNPTKKKKIGRALSIQSQFADYLAANNHNFGGSIFSNSKETVEQEAFDMFKNSAIGFTFPPVQLNEAGSKQMFGKSGLGIQNGDAFNNLSGFSEKNSFLKFEGEKGVYDAQIFQSGQLKRSSGVYNQLSPGFLSLGGTNSTIFKN